MLKVSPASRDYREHFISRKWKRHILHEFNILIWPRKINEDRPLILIYIYIYISEQLYPFFTKFNLSPHSLRLRHVLYGDYIMMYIPEFTIVCLPKESMRHLSRNRTMNFASLVVAGFKLLTIDWEN